MSIKKGQDVDSVVQSGHNLCSDMSMALRDGCQSKRVVIVFDTYKEISIKNSDRSLRREAPGHRLQSITASYIVRQWRNCLSKVNNKTSVITFLVTEWKKVEYTEQLRLATNATRSLLKAARRFNNKTSVITFLVTEWKKVEYTEQLRLATNATRSLLKAARRFLVSGVRRRKPIDAYCCMQPMLPERGIKPL